MAGRRNKKGNPILWASLGRLVAWLLRALGATWRVHVEGPDPFGDTGPLVLGTWHRSLLIAAHCWRDRGLVIPVSRSRDGDRIDGVLQRLGFAESARGSSSRGATAVLRELIRRVRQGEVIGMLPDGPRGPSGVAKPGIVALARVTGARLVPVGIAARPVWRFGSWDRAELPRPFARVHCVYGEPLRVPREAGGEELEKEVARFEEELRRVDALAMSAARCGAR
ncbi:MAG: lysophospholipid acyltransferase family protein [Myxococcota bacterium]